MHYSLRYISLIGIGFILGYFYRSFTYAAIDLEPATEVYKEVAHLSYDRFVNGTLICVDMDNDIAYYRANDRMQTMATTDTVQLDSGESLSVKEVDLRGFYLQLNGADVHAGMSGSPVWLDNEIVGYISKLLDADTLYCIWAN